MNLGQEVDTVESKKLETGKEQRREGTEVAPELIKKHLVMMVLVYIQIKLLSEIPWPTLPGEGGGWCIQA